MSTLINGWQFVDGDTQYRIKLNLATNKVMKHYYNSEFGDPKVGNNPPDEKNCNKRHMGMCISHDDGNTIMIQNAIFRKQREKMYIANTYRYGWS